MFVQSLGRKLVARGHRVSVVGTWEGIENAEEEDQGVRIYRVGSRVIPVARFLQLSSRVNRQLRRLHEEHPIDIIEATNLGMAFISRYPPAKRVVRLHGGHVFHCHEMKRPYGRWRFIQEKRSFRNADFICSCGGHVAAVTSDLMNLEARSVRVLHNLAGDSFRPIVDCVVDPNQILFVGVVHEQKGIRQLVLAMLQVLSEYPDASLRVVGRDGISARTRGSYMESELLPLIPEKFRGKFEFSGKVPHEQMPSVIASAGICVYPSHTEAFPIAWIETLGMGRPIIGADIGAGREILRDGETGLLCDPHDPTDIAEKILTLLRKPDLAKRIAKAGFTDFNARFDPERLVSDNIAFYETCIRS